jgi:hypothetical protein
MLVDGTLSCQWQIGLPTTRTPPTSLANFRFIDQGLVAHACEVRNWHFSDIQPALTNVRFWRQSGHDSNGSLCRLMTQSGHDIVVLSFPRSHFSARRWPRIASSTVVKKGVPP